MALTCQVMSRVSFEFGLYKSISHFQNLAMKENLCFVYFRLCKEPPGTTRERVVYAKKLYESAFHPDTGDKQNVFGRMSFQVPGGMAITGAMLQFYRCVVPIT